MSTRIDPQYVPRLLSVGTHGNEGAPTDRDDYRILVMPGTLLAGSP
jgi:hypothetical protein